MPRGSPIIGVGTTLAFIETGASGLMERIVETPTTFADGSDGVRQLVVP